MFPFLLLQHSYYTFTAKLIFSPHLTPSFSLLGSAYLIKISVKIVYSFMPICFSPPNILTLPFAFLSSLLHVTSYTEDKEKEFRLLYKQPGLKSSRPVLTSRSHITELTFHLISNSQKATDNTV